MRFTDTPICRMRRHCRQCRTDAVFRANLCLQYGEWECPEGYPEESLPPDQARSQRGAQIRQDAPPVSPVTCAYGGKHIGTVWEDGCCGKKQEVPAFACSKSPVNYATMRRCARCDQYQPKA